MQVAEEAGALCGAGLAALTLIEEQGARRGGAGALKGMTARGAASMIVRFAAAAAAELPLSGQKTSPYEY
jgi:hypothetical protein